MRLLREHYRQNFGQLQHDFDTGARSFNALALGASLTLRAGGRGQEVIDKFTYLPAERYYQLARNSIRRYDPNDLILGDRYIGLYAELLFRVKGST